MLLRFGQSTIARISGETAAPSMKKTLLAYGLKRGRRTVPLNAAVAAAWKAGPMLRRGMGTYGRAKDQHDRDSVQTQ